MQASLERLRQRREERGDEGGFTLIELLIVIVILAILAAIVVFAVQNLSGSSAKASCESDVQTVDHAIQAYAAQMGSQPTSIADLMPTSTETGVNGDQVGPWLHNVPTNGKHYSIIVHQVGTAPNVKAYAAVVVPGATPAPSLGNNTNSVIYEPNGSPHTGSTAVGDAAVVTTTSSACALVTS